MRKQLCLFVLFLVSIFTLSASKDPISQVISKMSIREKVGQLYVVRPDALVKGLTPEEVNNHNNNGLTHINDEILEYYKNYPVGGVILFGKNIESPDQLQQYTEQIHNMGNIPTLIFIDEEGGPVSRLANHEAFFLPKFSYMLSLGEKGDESQALRVGQTIGSYLNYYGIDVDFAPVCDVNSNPENPIIGPRAFSSDPQIAADFSLKVLQGLNDQNIDGCLKHFPGHGDTKTDSHKSYTECLKTKEELLNCELIPFAQGVNQNAKFIMSAHVAYPNVTNDKLPATLSSYWLTDVLRKEMNYEGIIISDAMNMDAILKSYKDEVSAVMGIQAGLDMILMPYDFEKSFESVVKAVKSKKIKEKRLDESVYRILKYKQERFDFLNMNKE